MKIREKLPDWLPEPVPTTGLFPAGCRPGLVLGGGGARGMAAIGVLEVLEEEGARPAAVAGTSMGALVGAFLAAGYSALEMHEIVSVLRWTKVVDVSVAGGIIRGKRFGHWLGEHLPARFADLKIPLTVTATDIDSGELVRLDDGDLIMALRATCAFPGAFSPVRLDGRQLVDGGLLSTVPVDCLPAVDHDFVVACDFNPPRDRIVVGVDAGDRPAWSRFWDSLTFRRRNLAADILLKAVDIMQAEIRRRQFEDAPPRIAIRPPMPGVNLEDFRLAEKIIQAGGDEARAVMAGLEALRVAGATAPEPR